MRIQECVKGGNHVQEYLEDETISLLTQLNREEAGGGGWGVDAGCSGVDENEEDGFGDVILSQWEMEKWRENKQVLIPGRENRMCNAGGDWQADAAEGGFFVATKDATVRGENEQEHDLGSPMDCGKRDEDGDGAMEGTCCKAESVECPLRCDMDLRPEPNQGGVTGEPAAAGGIGSGPEHGVEVIDLTKMRASQSFVPDHVNEGEEVMEDLQGCQAEHTPGRGGLEIGDSGSKGTAQCSVCGMEFLGVSDELYAEHVQLCWNHLEGSYLGELMEAASAAITLKGFLQELNLLKYLEHFEACQIGLHDLKSVTEERLLHLGVPLGPRKKILIGAAVLRSSGLSEKPGSRKRKQFPKRNRSQAYQFRHLCDIYNEKSSEKLHDGGDFRRTEYQVISDLYRVFKNDGVNEQCGKDWEGGESCGIEGVGRSDIEASAKRKSLYWMHCSQTPVVSALRHVGEQKQDKNGLDGLDSMACSVGMTEALVVPSTDGRSSGRCESRCEEAQAVSSLKLKDEAVSGMGVSGRGRFQTACSAGFESCLVGSDQINTKEGASTLEQKRIKLDGLKKELAELESSMETVRRSIGVLEQEIEDERGKEMGMKLS